jgi:hypothetical protein
MNAIDEDLFPDPIETPLGDELDGANNTDPAEGMYEDNGHHDDDPNPYAGTFSED